MRVAQSVVCRNCWKNFQEKCLSFSPFYPEKSVRLNYFVDTLVSWTALIKILLQIESVWRSNWQRQFVSRQGSKGIKNSRLNAILHDAGGFQY